MANEWVVQPRLPFLNECKFKASIVGTADKKRNRGPNVEILMLTPEPTSEFTLNKIVIAELKICMADPIQNLGCTVVMWVLRIYTQLGKKNSFEKRLWEARVEPHKCTSEQD